MEEYFIEIFKIVFAPSAVVIGVVYILRKYLDKSFEKDLEKYKIELSNEYEISKLSFENELKIKFYEYQTRFSNYHQTQIKLTAKLFKLFNRATNAIYELVKPLQMGGKNDLKEKKIKTAQEFNELSNFYSNNRIYFDENICAKMDQIMEVLIDSFVSFDTAHVFSMDDSDSYKIDDSGLWIEAYNKFKDNVPTLRSDIEDSFRKIITVKSE